MFTKDIQKLNFAVPVLGFLFMGMLLYFNWEQLLYFCPQSGDYALLALSVEQAKDGIVFSGPYSRFEFNHPLPTYFYIYALLEPYVWFSQYWMSKYQLISFLINSFCILASLIIFKRLTKKNSYCLILLVAVICCFLRTYFIGSWGPSTLPAPLLLLAISFPALIIYGQGYLPIVTISSIFVSSNHLIGAMIAVVFFVWGLIHYLFKRNYNFVWSRSILLSITLILVSTAPLVLDLIINQDNSNPLKVWNYLSLNQHSNSFQDTIQIFINHLWPKKLHITFSTLWFSLIWLSIIVTYHRLDFEFKLLTQLTLILNVIAIYFAYGLKGNDYGYLFSFYAVAQVLTFTLAIIVYQKLIANLLRIPNLSFTCNKWKVLSSPLLNIILSSCLVAGLTNYNFSRRYEPKNCKLEQSVTQQTKIFDPTINYRLRMPHLESWNITALLILELYKQGINICVEPSLEFLFRKSLTCKSENYSKEYVVLNVAPVSLNLHAGITNYFLIGRDAFWIDKISNERVDQS